MATEENNNSAGGSFGSEGWEGVMPGMPGDWHKRTATPRLALRPISHQSLVTPVMKGRMVPPVVRLSHRGSLVMHRAV